MTAPPLGSPGAVLPSGPLAAVMSMLACPAPAAAGCGMQDSPVAGFAAMVAAALAGQDVDSAAPAEVEGALTGEMAPEQAAGPGTSEASDVSLPGVAPLVAPLTGQGTDPTPSPDLAPVAQASPVVAVEPAAVPQARDGAPEPVAPPLAPIAPESGAAPRGVRGLAVDESAPAAGREPAGPPPGSVGAGLARAAAVAPDHASVHALAPAQAPGVDVPAGPEPAAAPTQATAQASAPALATSNAPSNAPVVAAVAGLAPTTLAEGPPADARVVSAQVLPEVAELSRRGPGVHRVTLQLHPETLGEVKVVLTMRGGEVHVSLAAGQEARGALRESLPDLHRLLEGSGVRDAQVALRELSGGAAPASGTPAAQQNGAGQGFGQQLGGQLGDQASAYADQRGAHDRASGQHDGRAGTRGDGQTTDGTFEGRTAHPVAPVAPAARDARVDLVM